MTATMDNILYFCNVKTTERHNVAASGSVFCAFILSKLNNRIECGSSNAHKVTALLNLTARNAVSLLSKFNRV